MCFLCMYLDVFYYLRVTENRHNAVLCFIMNDFCHHRQQKLALMIQKCVWTLIYILEQCFFFIKEVNFSNASLWTSSILLHNHGILCLTWEDVFSGYTSVNCNTSLLKSLSNLCDFNDIHTDLLHQLIWITGWFMCYLFTLKSGDKNHL